MFVLVKSLIIATLLISCISFHIAVSLVSIKKQEMDNVSHLISKCLKSGAGENDCRSLTDNVGGIDNIVLAISPTNNVTFEADYLTYRMISES